jgi:hypothetical protein
VRKYLDSAPSRTAPVSRDERISGSKLFTALLQQMATVSTPASTRQLKVIAAKFNVLNILPLTALLSST